MSNKHFSFTISLLNFGSHFFKIFLNPLNQIEMDRCMVMQRFLNQKSHFYLLYLWYQWFPWSELHILNTWYGIKLPWWENKTITFLLSETLLIQLTGFIFLSSYRKVTTIDYKKNHPYLSKEGSKPGGENYPMKFKLKMKLFIVELINYR